MVSHLRSRVALVALACSLSSLAPEVALAEGATPIGRWRTIDDATKKPRSIIRIWEEQGRLFGKIEELIREPGEEPDPICTKCPGPDRDKKVKGLTVLKGLKRSGPQSWDSGTILDPKNGNVYSCYLELRDGGKWLELRGFIGLALFGRTQKWYRVE